MSATGLLASITSPSGWLVLASCASVPPLLMMYYSKQPATTMSESIQQALK